MTEFEKFIKSLPAPGPNERMIPVPVSRYEELVRAETERNVLEAAISGRSSYTASVVLDAIQSARRIEAEASCPQCKKCSAEQPEEGKDDAE